MLISRTPYRISFFGGGTDYPAWYRENGGGVLSATIDKYCYVTCRELPPFFEHRLRVVWSKIELVREVGRISHPSVRETLRYLGFEGGLEIHHDGDLPGQSGIGSSSAFTVGLLHVLKSLKGEFPGKHDLALESIEIEQNWIRETVGSQDQVSAAYGGFNRITFGRDGAIEVEPTSLPAGRLEALNDQLMLFFTGLKRNSSDIAASYCFEAEPRRRLFARTETYVARACSILENGGSLDAFGDLLHEGWMTKREFSDRVSTPEIDAFYQKARAHGAVGGKLLGAGGGGFLLLFAPPSSQAKIRRALGDLVEVPFSFEDSGSRIIFSEPDSEPRERGNAAPECFLQES